MVTPEQVKTWISANLADADVVVEGDGRHFAAIIVSDAFDGKSSVQRHQLVYAALGAHMKSDVHALSMKTYTKSEYAA